MLVPVCIAFSTELKMTVWLRWNERSQNQCCSHVNDEDVCLKLDSNSYRIHLFQQWRHGPDLLERFHSFQLSNIDVDCLSGLTQLWGKIAGTWKIKCLKEVMKMWPSVMAETMTRCLFFFSFISTHLAAEQTQIRHEEWQKKQHFISELNKCTIS